MDENDSSQGLSSAKNSRNWKITCNGCPPCCQSKSGFRKQSSSKPSPCRMTVFCCLQMREMSRSSLSSSAQYRNKFSFQNAVPRNEWRLLSSFLVCAWLLSDSGLVAVERTGVVRGVVGCDDRNGDSSSAGESGANLADKPSMPHSSTCSSSRRCATHMLS